MSVAFADSGNYVGEWFKNTKRCHEFKLTFDLACGGMDNMCTVYDLNNRDATGAAKIVRELAGYEGFLSSCRFLDDKTLITGSGDMRM